MSAPHISVMQGSATIHSDRKSHSMLTAPAKIEVLCTFIYL